MDKIRSRIQGRLHSFLQKHVPAELADRFGFYIGCATLESHGTQRLERLVYQALDAAFSDSLRQQRRELRRETRLLQELLRSQRLFAVYQPVADLHERRVLGYEALSRPDLPGFENTDHLFRVAYENEAIWELERLCRNRIFASLRGLSEDQLLFLNIEPETIHDPELRSDRMEELLRKASLSPDRIVLELTEHAAVRDFGLFRQNLRHFQAAGFRLAVDDVGSAYSGLKSIAELKPDFMKIDQSLVRGVHADDIKRELLGTIFKFSRSTGIGLVAEGIEETEELRTVQDLGIRFAQGYLLAHPGADLAGVDFGRAPP
jgi:EAL domain-containing protein (putative c-di-GMP-specific phosphodiesterase class I)